MSKRKAWTFLSPSSLPPPLLPYLQRFFHPQLSKESKKRFGGFVPFVVADSLYPLQRENVPH